MSAHDNGAPTVPEIYYSDERVTLYHGDCLDVLRELPDESVHAIVTDPPAGISFMGKDWDGHKGGREQWSAWLADVMREAYRVTKPGGHALVWALPRTSHWTACGLEDAGWEIRDKIVHLFGTGFPKSLDVSKAIDKAAPRVGMFDAFAAHFRDRRAASGLTQKAIAQHFPSKTGGLTGCVWNWENAANVPTLAQWKILAPMLGLSDEWRPLIERVEAEREVVGKDRNWGAASHSTPNAPNGEWDITAPATPDAERWQGWGTALKPAAEDWWLARKPLTGTVAANVLQYGTGALNIDGCRVGDTVETWPASRSYGTKGKKFNTRVEQAAETQPTGAAPAGRWPTNVLLDEEMARRLDEQAPDTGNNGQTEFKAGKKFGNVYGDFDTEARPGLPKDKGGASRFFPTFRYEAKAPTSERPRVNGTAHPTVKPLDLMRWLVRLVTPPGGTVLEPFAGSGTTVEACLVEGFRCIAIEKTDEYLPLIMQRVNRRRDPVAYIEAAGDDLGLFGIGDA